MLLIHLTKQPLARPDSPPLMWVIGPGVSEEMRKRFTTFFEQVNAKLEEEQKEGDSTQS